MNGLPKAENSTEQEVLDVMDIPSMETCPVSVQEISKRSHVPEKVVEVTLRNLQKKGLVVFKPGRGWKKEKILYPTQVDTNEDHEIISTDRTKGTKKRVL